MNSEIDKLESIISDCMKEIDKLTDEMEKMYKLQLEYAKTANTAAQRIITLMGKKPKLEVVK